MTTPYTLDELIAQMCPHLSPPEQREAAENFDRFATLLCEIIIRGASEPGILEKLAQVDWEQRLAVYGPAKKIPIAEQTTEESGSSTRPPVGRWAPMIGGVSGGSPTDDGVSGCPDPVQSFGWTGCAIRSDRRRTRSPLRQASLAVAVVPLSCAPSPTE